jgi:hypothetical protein
MSKSGFLDLSTKPIIGPSTLLEVYMIEHDLLAERIPLRNLERQKNSSIVDLDDCGGGR